MSLGRIPVQKVSAARAVASAACEDAFDRPADRRICRLGNELMVTALASQQEIELGKILKGRKGSRAVALKKATQACDKHHGVSTNERLGCIRGIEFVKRELKKGGF